MQNLPHHYRVAANAAPEGDVSLSSEKLETLPSAPPQEFGGPGDRWSPETLLVAAIADCFVLTFRAIAKVSDDVEDLEEVDDVEGTLERGEGKTKFTQFKANATLDVPPDTDEQRAQRILGKAETSCLITNSLSATTHLNAVVVAKSLA